MSTLALDKAIYSTVTGDAICAALLMTRFYPGAAPQNADVSVGDYCVYTFGGGEYAHTFDGREGDVKREMTILGFSSSESGRMALAKALIDALDPKAVAAPVWPKTVTVGADSLVIQHCLLNEGGEDFLEPGLTEEGGEVVIYPFSQTYGVAYAV
jgi:hypothetical protein